MSNWLRTVFLIIIYIGVTILLVIILNQDKAIQCYQDYIETNIITTRCEKYFKDLKLGSDSNE